MKLGRNSGMQGVFRKSFVPPAGRNVNASVARNGVSPGPGTVMISGDFNNFCTFWNGHGLTSRISKKFGKVTD